MSNDLTSSILRRLSQSGSEDRWQALHGFLLGDGRPMSPRMAARRADQLEVISVLTDKRQITWDELADLVKVAPERLCVAAIRLSQLGVVRVDVNAGATAIYLTSRYRKLKGVPAPQATL
jgi:hypothetical protein